MYDVCPSMRTLRAGMRLVWAFSLAATGCAIRDYAPSVPAFFMGDAGHTRTTHEVHEWTEPQPQPPDDRSRAAPPANDMVLDTPFRALSKCELLTVVETSTAAEGNIQLTAAQATPKEEPELIRPVESGISLNEAIMGCLSADPKLRAAWEEINKAKGDLLTSSLLPNPTLTGDGLLMPLTRAFTPTNQGGPPQTDWLIAFPIDWFVFGKRAAAIASARLGVEVTAADYSEMVRQRVSAAIAAYYDVLEAHALLELAKQDLENLRDVERMAKERLKVGGIAEIDVDRARLAVFDSQRELRRRETALVSAKAVLRALMGRLDFDPSFAAAGSLTVAEPAEPLAAEEALAVAEQERPDLISLRRQLAKAEADVGLEQRKAFPNVTPSAGYTRQFQATTIGFPDASSWNVLLNMSLPLFDRNQGNILKARSVEAQTYSLLQGQLVNMRAEIEQAVQEFKMAHTNVTADDAKQLENARSVLARVKAAYKTGGKTLVEVLDAERAYRDTYRLVISSRSSYWHALYKLNAAMGRQILR
jgi:cobalt-zinc-cadmium efflux system outer membrane protein